MSDGVVHVEPLTAARWDDAVVVFGTRGDAARCWCQYFRLEPAAWKASTADANRRRLEREVAAEPPPGLLAYLDGTPVGWLALGPRPAYARLSSRRALARAPGPALDDGDVWSVTCFVVRVGHRGRGVATELLRAAPAFARSHGARALEGYPVDTEASGRRSNAELYHGVASTFRACGFEEVARTSPTRPVMRLALG
jgi:GNAT superfamily N-acetyltransferase